MQHAPDDTYVPVPRRTGLGCPLDGVPNGPGVRGNVALANGSIVSLVILPDADTGVGLVRDFRRQVIGAALHIAGGGAGSYVSTQMDAPFADVWSFRLPFVGNQLERAVNLGGEVEIFYSDGSSAISPPLVWQPLPDGQECGVHLPYLPDGDPDPLAPSALQVALVDDTQMFSFLWGTTQDYDGNGVCDFDEFSCIEAALGSGAHPALVKAFLHNQSAAVWDVHPFGASNQLATDLLAAWMTMGKTYGGLRILAGFDSEMPPVRSFRYDFSGVEEAESVSKQALRNRLIERYLDVVRFTAERLGKRLPSEVDVEDLMSAGLFGLMDAIDAFDPDRGVKFETYCAQRIRGAIFDELRAMVARSWPQSAWSRLVSPYLPCHCSAYTALNLNRYGSTSTATRLPKNRLRCVC